MKRSCGARPRHDIRSNQRFSFCFQVRWTTVAVALTSRVHTHMHIQYTRYSWDLGRTKFQGRDTSVTSLKRINFVCRPDETSRRVPLLFSSVRGRSRLQIFPSFLSFFVVHIADGVGYGCSGERRASRLRVRERERERERGGQTACSRSYTCNVARRMRYRTLTRATYRSTTIPYEEYIIYSLLPRYCTDCPGWQAQYFDKYGTCRGYYLETTTRHNPGTVFLSSPPPPRPCFVSRTADRRGHRPEKKSRARRRRISPWDDGTDDFPSRVTTRVTWT